MGSRWYDPAIGRFISADTIVPDPTNPQSYNRYSYVINNPLKYTDPSGHCFTPSSAVICLIVLGGVALLQADSAQPPPPSNYPTNNTIMRASENEDGEVVQAFGCTLSVQNCFHVTPEDQVNGGFNKVEENAVWLSSFDDGYVSQQDFFALMDEVAADLNDKDLGVVGLNAGRSTYDTPFYNGGGSPDRTDLPEGYWPSDQQVCIENIRCSGRSDINYFAQGMWAAATDGVTGNLPTGFAVAGGWKAVEYRERISEEALFWLTFGYEWYVMWEAENTISP